MSHRAARGIVILLLIGMFVQLGVIFYVWHANNTQDAHLIEGARAGCRRVKDDRKTQANAYRLAAAEERQEKEPIVANEWAGLAARQERRARIDCIKAYPKESVFP